MLIIVEQYFLMLLYQDFSMNYFQIEEKTQKNIESNRSR